MKKMIYGLVLALVCGAIAQYTMLDIKYLLDNHRQQVIRMNRGGRQRDMFAL